MSKASKSKEIFIHRDGKAIRSLIKEIGEERYLVALEDSGLTGQLKPKRLQDFFLEWEDGYPYLCHQYPMGKKRRVLNIIGYQSIPFLGWERTRINVEN